ncbi:hypothetical protein GCM10022291_00570 [Postechiella marina]|uniref:Lipoprotein n=1 Tax=Postechiella marina TaxID=943941 RepID=A0ABP8BYH2_9FLAO
MKNILYCFILIVLFSCGKDKVILLPEINHSKISEIQDVSAAYLFYDETKKDSVELNRKNLISTTNWLVNVDKRLTLKQAMPHIKYLQEKKANSSHKKENVKNFFTCNNSIKKSLGFVEFTKQDYILTHANNALNLEEIYWLNFYSKDSITLTVNSKNSSITRKITTLNYLDSYLKDLFSKNEIDNHNLKMNLYFNTNLTFQNYISFKSTLNKLDFSPIEISNNEYIY